MRYISFILFIFISFCIAAQKKPAVKFTRILFVFDASKSMVAKHENTTRMDGAKNLFFKFIDSLSKDKTLLFALRMYGHTVKYPPGDCNPRDTRTSYTVGEPYFLAAVFTTNVGFMPHTATGRAAGARVHYT